MRSSLVLFLFFSAICIAGIASAGVLTPADLYVYYPMGDTAGTVLNDASPNSADATFYRTLKYSELPGVDVSNASVAGPTGFGNALGLGTKSVGGVDHQVLVDIPTSTNLPGAGDSYAVSFWASTSSWINTYGLLASYNLNGAQWSIGLHNSYDALVAWTGEADPNGSSFAWQADCSTLPVDTFAHFVVQFEGAAGITNVYVNGATSTDGGDANFWGNEKTGFTLGGRVLDARGYTVPANDTRIDDFAIISGVVDATDVNNLMTSGPSSLGTRCLANYAMEETTGTQLADSSVNANHGTLVGYAPSTMGLAERSVTTASRPGVFGNATEFASGLGAEHGEVTAVTDLPERGEAFTVCFWAKHDENMADLYGWDQSGMILSWSNDPTPGASGHDGLGFSVAFNYQEADGSLIVRRTSGNYTSTGDQDTYGVYLGEGSSGNGLNLDPTALHHFAVTVDETGTIMGIYVDGVLVGKQISNGFGVTDENMASIGCRIKNGVLDSALSGYIDDLAVFKGVLLDTQINDIMTRGVAAAVVPEPSAVVLLLTGLLAAVAAGRRVGRG
ncbi:MAG: PEP-CTERM sorting domain-containing protein [Pirellulales bacterium]|nr:PEP-CTERM sorting domain-containing protein [Pirellulales bacterium]